MKYTELTFTELVNKIGSSRFFDLPKMLKEVLSRLSPQEPKYKVYTALLTQSGTDAPVATVLENTLGDISFEGIDYINGVFNLKSNGLFIENKTVFFLAPSISSENQIAYIDEDTILVEVASEGNLQKSPIEIRVYN
jgi:hypothetical protein